MTPIEKCLTVWYEPDHPLHNDPLHPAIGLAGEAGELLNLYKKERFKDGVSWWDCACEHSKREHEYGPQDICLWEGDACFCKGYTPKILDELGDLWFYLRILAYQSDNDLTEWQLKNYRWIRMTGDELYMLSTINEDAAELLVIVEEQNIIPVTPLSNVYISFQRILNTLDTTLDQLTELNWLKLKDGDNNGWATARIYDGLSTK